MATIALKEVKVQIAFPAVKALTFWTAEMTTTRLVAA